MKTSISVAIRTLATSCALAALASAARAQEGEPTYELPYESLPAPVLPPVSEQHVIVLIANLPTNDRWTIPSTAQITSLMQQVRAYYLENSYGKVTFTTGQVVGTLELAADGSCELEDVGPIVEEAVAAAQLGGVDFHGYDHLVVFAPWGDCNWGGYYLGSRTYELGPGDQVALKTSLVHVRHTGMSAVTHELGHGLGAGHAGLIDCPSATFPEGSGVGCTPREYADLYSVMGGIPPGQLAFHFSALHKDMLGWFAPADVVEVTAPGVYDVFALETNLPGVKALRIPRCVGNTLYVEYRRPLGFDSGIQGGGARDIDGAMFHLRQEWGGYEASSRLLDPSPQIPNPSCSPTPQAWCGTETTPVLKLGDPPLVDPFTQLSFEVIFRNHRKVTLRVLDVRTPGVTPPVANLVCSDTPLSHQSAALLNWVNMDCYDSIDVERDGLLLASVPGTQVGYFDLQVAPGAHLYRVTGRRPGMTSTGIECSVTVTCERCRADYGLDGLVSDADVLVFQQHYAAGDPLADLNCDGNVNLLDVNQMSSQYGMNCY